VDVRGTGLIVLIIASDYFTTARFAQAVKIAEKRLFFSFAVERTAEKKISVNMKTPLFKGGI
jgi:hypothetical protein